MKKLVHKEMQIAYRLVMSQLYTQHLSIIALLERATPRHTHTHTLHPS